MHLSELTTQKTFGAIIADVLTMTRCTSKVQRDAQQIPIRSKPSPGVTETEVAQAGMIFETSKFKFEYINIGDG